MGICLTKVYQQGCITCKRTQDMFTESIVTFIYNFDLKLYMLTGKLLLKYKWYN